MVSVGVSVVSVVVLDVALVVIVVAAKLQFSGTTS